MKWLPVLALCAGVPAFAHVMSMSSGDLVIHGSAAHYEFRLPLYEVPHVANPQQSLFAHIRFSAGGHPAHLLTHSCRPDEAQAAYLCSADFLFVAPVETLDVDCTFPEVTVPNHVHLLRADNNGKRDQALLDISFPHATLRFRPPTALETAAAQAGGGFMRAFAGSMQILFLMGLVLAARTRRELLALTCMFLAGQMVTALVVPHTNWQPAPRFVEAAAALTIAYLALEILILPAAGTRWLILGVLGGFHGLYFALFMRATGFHAAYVLAGGAAAEIAIIGLCASIFSLARRKLAVIQPVPVSASLLLAVGLAWFFVRLRS